MRPAPEPRPRRKKAVTPRAQSRPRPPVPGRHLLRGASGAAAPWVTCPAWAAGTWVACEPPVLPPCRGATRIWSAVPRPGVMAVLGRPASAARPLAARPSAGLSYSLALLLPKVTTSLEAQKGTWLQRMGLLTQPGCWGAVRRGCCLEPWEVPLPTAAVPRLSPEPPGSRLPRPAVPCPLQLSSAA